MDYRVDLEKLQLLNDRIGQIIDAIEHLREVAAATQPAPSERPPVLDPRGAKRATLGPRDSMTPLVW